ncbi:MAG: DUF1552 domain-containing protein [Polyangiales bacterium]
MSPSSSMNRRNFLRGAAGATLTIPFLSSMPGVSKAGPTSGPKRIVLFWTSSGTIPEAFAPTSGTTGSPILHPLDPHKNDLIVLSGVSMMSTYSTPDTPGGAHQKGIAHCFTGIPLLTGSFPAAGGGGPCGYSSGPSIDQLIAKKIGSAMLFPSLEFGVQIIDTSPRSRISYSGPNAPVTPMEDPTAAFSRVFGGVSSSTTPAPADTSIARQRKSVLDGVIANFNTLNPKLGKDDQIKLDAHLSNVRALEVQIAKIGTTGKCTLPGKPGAIDLANNDNFPALADVQMKLLVQSLSCNLTQVASIQFSHAVSGTVHSWVPVTGPKISEGHHALTHKETDPTARTQLVAIGTWYAQKFADLIAMMKATPEGSGSMFDNTLIVWGNELGDAGKHDRHNIPFVLAGSCAGQFKGGRTLKFNDAPHNQLLVSMANAMGVPITQFGDPTQATGPLPGLTG